MTARVIEWLDGEPLPTAASELRARPGQWAKVADCLHPSEISDWVRNNGLAADDIEIQRQAADDGEYGVLYDVRARAIENQGSEQ